MQSPYEIEFRAWADVPRGSRRDQAIEGFMRRRYMEDAPRVGPPFTVEELIDVLGSVAMESVGSVVSDMDVLRLHRFAAVVGVEQAPAFVNFVGQLGLILPTKTGNYRFAHPLLRDFLAFRYACLHLREPHWYENPFGANPAYALERLADERAVEPLLVALRSSDGLVRWAAATALGELGDWRAVEPLIELLKHDNFLHDDGTSVRQAAATALGKLGDERALEALSAGLRDESPKVRHASAEALKRLRERQSVDDLLERMKDSTEETLLGAAQFALQNVIPDLHITPDDGPEELDEPDIVEPRQTGSTIAMHDENKLRVRSRAIRALGALGDSRSVEPLIELLADTSDLGYTGRLDEVAADALSKLGAPAVEPLIILLNDEDVRVRGTAARALGWLNDKRALNPLIERLTDPEPQVRIAAIYSLSDLGDKRAVSALIRLLNDQTDVRWDRVCDAAVKALDKIATPEALIAIKVWRKVRKRKL